LITELGIDNSPWQPYIYTDDTYGRGNPRQS